MFSCFTLIFTLLEYIRVCCFDCGCENWDSMRCVCPFVAWFRGDRNSSYCCRSG